MNHPGETYPDGFPVTLTGAWNGGPPSSAPRSLAIVGSHPATRELAPYDDPNFDIWLFNEAPQKPEVYRRWDAAFQLHIPEVYTSANNWVNAGHWPWLQQDHGPDKTIWMQEVDPRVPNSRKYPLDEVLAMVGMPYLRSTPAEALALAIYLGYEHIQLYGSELTSNTEYMYQATNYAFWIGFAKGRGVNLEMKCWQQEFYSQPIYGYEGELQLSSEYFESRLALLEPEHRIKKNGLEKALNRVSDAMQAADFQKVANMVVAIEEIAADVGKVEGAISEAKHYLERKDFISRQEFERRAAKAQRDGPDLEQTRYKNAGIVEYLWNGWRLSGRLDALQQLRHFFNEKIEATLAAGRMSGAFMENAEYLNEYDRRVTAAGGQRAVVQAGVADAN